MYTFNHWINQVGSDIFTLSNLTTFSTKKTKWNWLMLTPTGFCQSFTKWFHNHIWKFIKSQLETKPQKLVKPNKIKPLIDFLPTSECKAKEEFYICTSKYIIYFFVFFLSNLVQKIFNWFSISGRKCISKFQPISN